MARPIPRTDAVIEIDSAGGVHVPADPRDATIRELAAEVERLAAGLQDASRHIEANSTGVAEDGYAADLWQKAASARALLARLGVKP